VSTAPSAKAEQEPSVVRVTSTWTPMNLATVPSASFTGAAGGVRALMPQYAHAR
jgi:hypothetical protein